MDKIQIVLASPSDLAQERAMIKELVNKLNTVYEKNDLHFDLRMWEDTSPGISVTGPQGVIDTDLEIEKADIFICLYWKRVGTIIPTEGLAGTEHELNTAIASFLKLKKPDIKVFFKDTSDCEESEELKHIRNIANRIKNLSLYAHFKTTEELKDDINIVLQRVAAEKLKRSFSVDPKMGQLFRISTSRELMSNIRSGNTLIIEKGFYDVLENVDNPYLQRRDVNDGEEVIVKGVEDLIIIGNDAGILAKPRYATVLTFQECNNIKLSGLSIGHVPDKGFCTGAVVELINCNNITIDSISLFGCGIYGLVLSNCENVIVNGSRIFECTYGAIVVRNSTLSFNNSTIYDCKDLISSLIEITDGSVNMNNASIHDCSSNEYMVNLISNGGRFTWITYDGVCAYNNQFYDFSNVQIFRSGFFNKDNILTKAEMEKTDDERITTSFLRNQLNGFD